MAAKQASLGARLLEIAAHRLEGNTPVSLRAIAAEAGTSTMAIYTHFGGRTGLDAALAERAFGLLQEAQRAALAATPAGLEAELLALCEAYGDLARRRPAHYRLMMKVSAGGPSAQASYAMLREAVERWLQCDAGLRLCASRPVTGDTLASQLFAYCHGFLSLELAGLMPLPPSATAAAYRAGLLALLR